jgi:hypothetical protein
MLGSFERELKVIQLSLSDLRAEISSFVIFQSRTLSNGGETTITKTCDMPAQSVHEVTLC